MLNELNKFSIPIQYNEVRFRVVRERNQKSIPIKNKIRHKKYNCAQENNHMPHNLMEVTAWSNNLQCNKFNKKLNRFVSP